jgi:hypothetical protein
VLPNLEIDVNFYLKAAISDLIFLKSAAQTPSLGQALSWFDKGIKFFFSIVP